MPRAAASTPRRCSGCWRVSSARNQGRHAHKLLLAERLRMRRAPTACMPSKRPILPPLSLAPPCRVQAAARLRTCAPPRMVGTRVLPATRPARRHATHSRCPQPPRPRSPEADHKTRRTTPGRAEEAPRREGLREVEGDARKRRSLLPQQSWHQHARRPPRSHTPTPLCRQRSRRQTRPRLRLREQTPPPRRQPPPPRLRPRHRRSLQQRHREPPPRPTLTLLPSRSLPPSLRCRMRRPRQRVGTRVKVGVENKRE